MIGNAPVEVYDPFFRRFISKEEYQKTEWWKNLKQRRIEKANDRCELCGKVCAIYQLHHKHYKTYGFHENINDVQILCPECHHSIHEKEWALNKQRPSQQFQTRRQENNKNFKKFIDTYFSREKINGGDINLSDQKEIKKYWEILFGNKNYLILQVQEYFTELKWDEINNMVISGYAYNISWSALTNIINVSQGNISTYRLNFYKKKKATTKADPLSNGILWKINHKEDNFMKPITNIANVQEAGDSVKLPAGGYVCKYTKVEDNPDKNYLYMEYDIAEGTFKDYYKQLEERANFWGGRCYRSYTDKALPMFKRMCSAVTKSNKGFIFDGNEHADETTLVGKYVGMILGEEEYVGNDGSTKTRLYVAREISVEDIKANNFKIPELKKLQDNNASSTDNSFVDKVANTTEEEVPFN